MSVRDLRMFSVTPLGAGQHVGRSCLYLHIGGWRLLLDCGIHPGFSDARRFPDFSMIPGVGSPSGLTGAIDAVILSHFHLDHSGALVCGNYAVLNSIVWRYLQLMARNMYAICSRISPKCWAIMGLW